MEQPFNPLLTPNPSDKGGETGIEHPARVQNIAWQTRRAAPTPADEAFADALQRLFGEEVHDLATLASRLDGIVLPPAGAPRWTEALLGAELARLGE